ncbi:glycerate kinase family protein [Chengkuizengella axinellae]|uniref:Glycerate kinase n=1 Tax=Chengkuizengella axinellae TaxID=3064388 RepID=A0ABT9IWH9_9BACL|nr:glycerate kinase [Chengkuizengella sp. 2205SS18-9]MDP5273724.1 glycerate kinase [Chengkuizengella sp. 2205SS18-9]
MKVIIALDSFKGSVSSIQGSKAIALGIKDIYPNAEIFTLPLADGGEGTVEAFSYAENGEIITKEVTGPLNEKVAAEYGILGNHETAVIEVASACGLPLVPKNKRNPLYTTTYGVGELILDAIEKGCRKFIIGLGGSSTNDAGIGMLQALGYRFLDENDQEVGLGGQALIHIQKMNNQHVHPKLKECFFTVACDVNNSLHGSEGAAYVFAEQKGATKKVVQQLDEGLVHFDKMVKQDLSIDLQQIKGAGAAGGLGAAFHGLLNAELRSGVELVLEHFSIEEKIRGTHFVITGEGSLDEQTSMGKAPLGIAKMAQKHQVPVIAFAGRITRDTSVLNEQGITSYFSIVNEPISLEKAMLPDITLQNLRIAANQLFRLIQAMK